MKFLGDTHQSCCHKHSGFQGETSFWLKETFRNLLVLRSFTLQHTQQHFLWAVHREVWQFFCSSSEVLFDLQPERGYAVAKAALRQENTLSCREKDKRERKGSWENLDAVIGLESLNFQNQLSSCCVYELWTLALWVAGVNNVFQLSALSNKSQHAAVSDSSILELHVWMSSSEFDAIIFSWWCTFSQKCYRITHNSQCSKLIMIKYSRFITTALKGNNLLIWKSQKL